MQCAKCQKTVEVPASGTVGTTCPDCGSPLETDSAARSGRVLWIAIVSILIVGLAAVSVASTLYAMRTVEQRDRAKEDFSQSSETLDEIVVAVSKSGKLKGAAAAEARQEVFQPAVDHYDRIIEKYKDDEQMMPAVASAKLRKAALQAKLGMPECVRSLSDGTGTLNQMIKLDFGEESYPSFQNSVLKIAEPMDWITVKGSSPMAQGMGLYTGIRGAVSAYKELNKKFPESVAFRDDLAELLKSSALLLGAMNNSGQALLNWAQARDVLESMVRDEPDNVSFQERYAESLVNAAKLERSQGKTAEAIADYKRAVELRQKMAEANPEDKSLQKTLARVQSDLESAEKFAASKKEAPADEKSPDKAAEKADSDEQADASQQEAPKDDANQK